MRETERVENSQIDKIDITPESKFTFRGHSWQHKQLACCLVCLLGRLEFLSVRTGRRQKSLQEQVYSESVQRARRHTGITVWFDFFQLAGVQRAVCFSCHKGDNDEDHTYMTPLATLLARPKNTSCRFYMQTRSISMQLNTTCMF